MLFDQPTSSLDPKLIEEVLEVIGERAVDGMTMLCVTHEMGLARRVADCWAFMNQGEIVEISPARRFFYAPTSCRRILL